MFAGPVRKRKHILVNSLPGFITEAGRLGIVGVKDLTLPQHWTGGQAFGAVLTRKLLVECRLENSDANLFHVIPRFP